MSRSGGGSGRQGGSFIWAAILILGGIGLLLFNLDIFSAYEPFLQYGVAIVFALIGLAFFGSYTAARDHWWRLIPAWTLLALAGMVYMGTLEALDQRISAAVLFWGQSLAFFTIYLIARQERWWAVIPGGFMLVLGGVIAISSRTEDPETLGTWLFVGLGLVFFLLYLIGEKRRLWWALIPGGVLVLFGVFLFSVDRNDEIALLRWWPILLVLAGLILAWRSTRRRSSEKISVQGAPNLSRQQRKSDVKASAQPRRLGEYSGPAPGASVEVLSSDDSSDDSR